MNQTRSAIIFSLLTAVFFLTFGHITTAAPGDLDTTFFQTGKRTVPFPQGNSEANAVVVQPDGKIVIAGRVSGTPNGFALVRLVANGNLDPDFGFDGKVTTPQTGVANALALQPDGKLVAVGVGSGGFVLVRYIEDGTLDSTFGIGGKVVTQIGGITGTGQSVAIQSDGKIVVGGTVIAPFAVRHFALARYNTNGSLDPTFDGDGMLTTPVGINDVMKVSLAIQPDGKIVAAGSTISISTHVFAVNRYNSDGQLDATFDGDGMVTTSFTGAISEARAVTFQPDGKIIVSGNVQGRFGLVRYNENGSLDTTFDGDGRVVTLFSTTRAAVAESVMVQPGGKIIAFGFWNDDFAIARYNPDGSPDLTLDSDGRKPIDIAGNDRGMAIALYPGDRYVLAGWASSAASPDFAVARVLAGPEPVNNLYISGRITDAGGRGISRARVVLTDADGDEIIQFTRPFGHYRFLNVVNGATYTVSVDTKRHAFEPSSIQVTPSTDINLDFQALP